VNTNHRCIWHGAPFGAIRDASLTGGVNPSLGKAGVGDGFLE